MKLKNVDGELYVDKKSKVFFKDDVIPERFKDTTEYDLFILDSDRPVKKEVDEYEQRFRAFQSIRRK